MEVILIFGGLVLLVLAGGRLFGVGGTGGGDSASLPPLLSGGGPMTLPASDIASYARYAGFAGVDLVNAVAVALAESGGNPVAYNPETAASGGTPEGLGSYGLWQIYRKAHPEFATYNLFDPLQNAQAAFSVYLAAGRSFRPWSTFNSQRYLAYVPAANSAVVTA